MGVLGAKGLYEIKSDLLNILDCLPTDREAPLDAKGGPALTKNCDAPTLFWSKPLGHRFGGTDLANGRHPVKTTELPPASIAPSEVVYLITSSMHFSQGPLQVYGQSDLLKVAAAIKSDNSVPLNEALSIKQPGRGGSVF